MATNSLNMNVGVAGGGLMGCGIAAKLAVAGVQTLVYDTAPDAANRVRLAIGVILDELRAGERIDQPQAVAAEARVQVVTEVEALAPCGYVIEAIFESLPAKHALYAQLEGVLPASAVIASSTSGFPPDQLAAHMARPDRFIVAHFWNPPHLTPLVEVLPAATTHHAVLDLTLRLLEAVACVPVLLNKAVPGFIGNRIQFAVLREALHLLQEGVADAATIDEVVKQTLGRRYRWVGPLEGADVGGISTFLSISQHLMPALAKDEGVLDVLQAHVDAGTVGLRAGRGFYEWDEARKTSYQTARMRMLSDG